VETGGFPAKAHAWVGERIAFVQVPLSALFCPVPKKIPTFDRVELEVVLTSKVAVKLKLPCSIHWFVPGIPPWNTLTVLESTAAMLTSLAEQLFALLTSARQLPIADAGVGMMANASSAKTNKNVLQQFVRQLIYSPPGSSKFSVSHSRRKNSPV